MPTSPEHSCAGLLHILKRTHLYDTYFGSVYPRAFVSPARPSCTSEATFSARVYFAIIGLHHITGADNVHAMTYAVRAMLGVSHMSRIVRACLDSISVTEGPPDIAGTVSQYACQPLWERVTKCGREARLSRHARLCSESPLSHLQRQRTRPLKQRIHLYKHLTSTPVFPQASPPLSSSQRNLSC